MERTVRSMVNAAFIGLLLFLFIVPPRYVNKVCGQMTALTAAAAERAIAGEDARDELGQLNRLYEQTAPVLRLFLDHTGVDEVGAAIRVCEPLTEPEALLSALNAVNAAAEHLMHIESFGPDSVL